MEKPGNILTNLYISFNNWEVPYLDPTGANGSTEISIKSKSGYDIAFDEEVYLDYPSSGALSDAFVTYATHGFPGTSAEYCIRSFSTSGFMSGAEDYNLGYSNDDTGKTLVWKTRLSPGRSLDLENAPEDTNIAIRASTYTSPGYWWMTVLTELE